MTLGSKINAAVEELLLLIIARVRALKQAQFSTGTGSNVDSFCKTIAFALDHMRLESLVRRYPDRSVTPGLGAALTYSSVVYLQNLGSSRSNARDENHLILISELSRGLRKELELT